MRRPKTIGSLFAGIGGLEVGLERATGAHTVWQCEREPYAARVLAKHWPEATRYDDVLTLANPPRVDVLCGGAPCQDISTAGKQAGIKVGTRSGLWFEYARIIREVEPRFVVVENVAAMLSNGLGIVLGDISAAGYDVAWDCVPAAAVGAPHRRDRVFLLAWRRGTLKVALRGSEQAFSRGIATVRGASEWPAGPSVPQHPWEPPRTARGVPDRAKKLRCLGNAVVPAVAEAVGHALLGLERSKDDRPASVTARLVRGQWHAPQAGLFADALVERFPRAGTVRDGVAYELVPTAPLAALDAAWPTAVAGDAKQTRNATVGQRHEGSAHHSGTTLTDAVTMWPSPIARDAKDTGDMTAVNARDGRPPDTVPRMVQAVGGGDIAPLSAAWVSCLMGLPPDWCDL